MYECNFTLAAVGRIAVIRGKGGQFCTFFMVKYVRCGENMNIRNACNNFTMMQFGKE